MAQEAAMTWGRPVVLHLLWLLPFVVAGLVWAHRSRVRDLGRLLGARLLERSVGEGLATRRAVQAVLWTCALTLSVLALAMPQAGADWRALQSEQAQVVVALDLSRSMNARDVLPSRLERARRDAQALIEVLPGDRVGLVIFASGAYPRSPLTTDRRVLSMMVDQARTEILRAQGSSLAAALQKSLDLLPKEGAGAQAIVLISDGEDHRPKALKQAVAQVQRREIPVFVLGVGSPEGAPIPMSSGDFKRGPDGQVVVSRLNTETLEAVARATGGSYTQSTTGDVDTLAIAQDLDRALTRQLGVVEQERIPRQVFQVPLGLAVLFALLATGMRDRPRLRLPKFGRSALAALVFLLPLAAKAQDLELTKLLAGEQYTAALSGAQTALEQDPQNLDLLWVQAESLYGLGQYEASAQIFEQIGAGAHHRGTREQARLNAARAFYKAGKLEQALEQSQAVLLDDLEQAQALRNVEQLSQEIMRRTQPPPPKEQEEEPSEEEQGGEGESPEESKPQEGEGEEQPQPQEGEGQGEGEEQDTGVSEQADGERAEGQASQDDGLLDAQAEESAGQAGTQQEEGEQEGEEGLRQPIAQGPGVPAQEDSPEQAAAREVLESVEEGSPRASYGGKGGGQDW
jgi:Ca-activated chloride channel family protein